MKNTLSGIVALVVAAGSVEACSGHDTIVVSPDGSPQDSGPAEGGPVDTGPHDSGPVDSGITPPSCALEGAGLSNCGPGGSGTESCCTSLAVPGGTYYRTYPVSDAGMTGADAGPTLVAPATVSGFRLDKYDVTVGRFRQYVNYLSSGTGAPPSAGSGKHAHLNDGMGLVNSGSTEAGVSYETGWDPSWNSVILTGSTALDEWDAVLTTECGQSEFATWTATPSDNENRPLDCVNWWASYAFCIWDGGFLPTEAEWEYAAAGGSEQRIYPWGSTAPGTDNQYAIYGDGENDCYYPTGTAAPCTGATNLAPVGTPVAGAGRWGQLDLAGNVWQWNLDWVAAYVVPCVDCAYLAPTTARIVRGGFGFLSADAVATLLAEFRGYSGPVGTAGDGNGFRCARVP